MPVPVAVAVTLVGAAFAAFAVPGPAQSITLQRHQAFCGKADHFAQEARVGALLQKLAKGDLVVGHRGGPRVRIAVRNPTLPSTAAVAIAVDKSPASARLSTVARRRLIHRSYTTRRDTTAGFEPSGIVATYALGEEWRELTPAALGVNMHYYGRLSYLRRNDEYPTTQQIGEVAHFYEYEAVVVPNARWPTSNVIVLTEHATPARISAGDGERVDLMAWREVSRSSKQCL